MGHIVPTYRCFKYGTFSSVYSLGYCIESNDNKCHFKNNYSATNYLY